MADKDLEKFARELGASTAGFMSDDEYYADADPDELLDDAWMMGATQDSFDDEGYELEGEVRERAFAAFKEGFTAAMKG